jgi:NAD(P)-dependent dehydrogenase (short-subunit alcohol dehydrogenase family)
MKTIAIFGGSGGLGTQVSKSLSDKYTIIALSSKDCDVTKPDECFAFFEKNRVDVLVNLAGINHSGFVHKMGVGGLADAEKMLAVNCQGAVNIAAACLPQMRNNGYGRIIFISSIAATKDMLGGAVYSACKAFVDKLARSISAENIARGVTCNSIQLGYFDGGMLYQQHDLEKIKGSIGLKRWGRIEELCTTIDYFINTEYLTGINMQLSGGF